MSQDPGVCGTCQEEKVRAKYQQPRIDLDDVTASTSGSLGGKFKLIKNAAHPYEYDDESHCANINCDDGRENIHSDIYNVNKGLGHTAQTGDWTDVEKENLERLEQLSENATEVVDVADIDWLDNDTTREWKKIQNKIDEFEQNTGEAIDRTAEVDNAPDATIHGKERIDECRSTLDNLDGVRHSIYVQEVVVDNINGIADRQNEQEMVVDEGTAISENEEDAQQERDNRVQELEEKLKEQREENLDLREENLDLKEQSQEQGAETETASSTGGPHTAEDESAIEEDTLSVSAGDSTALDYSFTDGDIDIGFNDGGDATDRTTIHVSPENTDEIDVSHTSDELHTSLPGGGDIHFARGHDDDLELSPGIGEEMHFSLGDGSTIQISSGEDITLTMGNGQDQGETRNDPTATPTNEPNPATESNTDNPHQAPATNGQPAGIDPDATDGSSPRDDANTATGQDTDEGQHAETDADWDDTPASQNGTQDNTHTDDVIQDWDDTAVATNGATETANDGPETDTDEQKRDRANDDRGDGGRTL
jgi:hypothetical protein